MDLSQASISELKELVNKASPGQLKAIAAALAKDPRAGARDLKARAERRLAWHRAEGRRLTRMMKYESDLLNRGYRLVAGVDEAGRGALAGPLVAAAVVLRPKEKIFGVNDSKLLPSWQRESLCGIIKQRAVAWSVGEIPHLEIDRIGLQAANLKALRQAVAGLAPRPDFVIVDCFKLDPLDSPSLALVKGDSLSQTVAAASIIAKVHRDRIMREHDVRFPGYGFKVNKGYSTPAHLGALNELGPCDLHRRSFWPVAQWESDQMELFEAERQAKNEMCRKRESSDTGNIK